MGSYRVQQGDTLSGIAGRFNTTVGALAKANGISNPNRINAGAVLTVPDSFSAAPAQANTTGTGTYTVKAGDTLSGIAGRFKTTVGKLQQLNNIANPNRINVGQKLKVPGGGAAPAPAKPAPKPAPAKPATYTVKSGDTLSGIASRHGTTVGALAALNGITNPNRINVGQTLRLPNGSTPVKPTGPVAPPPGPTKGGISLDQLKRIMPNLPDAKARAYLPYLNDAMVKGGINTPKRQAAFLAQLAHESGELKYFEEIASGAAYEGRKDLGNTQPGDGKRFKGRGPIQLTGRANYTAASKALGIDLVNNPTRAADPDVGFKVAVWFWNTRGLSAAADAGNFDLITKRINGGFNGKASRDRYWAKAKAVLGA